MFRLALLAVASVAFAAGPETVVFDTDSGVFGDDGAALVMLVRSPSQVALSGVTLTPGNVWPAQGAEYTLHILDLLHRPQVAVYLGAQTPLLQSAPMAAEFSRRWGPTEFIGALADDPSGVKPAPGATLTGRHPRAENAVEFLISEIERRPGGVTILATGPMTNIALALRMKPSIETRIRQIVFMGGNLAVRGNASVAAEFNFWFDPEAARIVLRSRIPRKIMFPLDVCNTAPIRKAEFDRIASAHTPIADLFREDLGNRYPGFLKHPEAVTYLWDSLAAAYLLDPGYVTKWDTRYLDAVTVWDKFYGATVPLDRRLAPEATPVTLAKVIDFPRVFALLKERLTRVD